MKPIFAWLPVALVSLSFLFSSTTGADSQQPDLPEHFVIPLSMDIRARRFPDLVNPLVKARPPRTWELREVPVRLRITHYNVEVLHGYQGRIRHASGEIPCVELVSDEAYTWAHWPASSTVGMGGFRIFTIEDGRSYLGWVYGERVRLAQVNESRDRAMALADRWTPGPPEGILEVPVDRLVPRAKEWREGEARNALRAEYELASLKGRPHGGFEIAIRHPRGRDSVTLVYEDGEWRLADESRVKETEKDSD